jgi:hypothetical protein
VVAPRWKLNSRLAAAMDRYRKLELEGEPIDASMIISETAPENSAIPAAMEQSATPSVLWEGTLASDRSGSQRTYFVRLYTDGAGTCQCPDFYFRATLRRDVSYACKHIRRARERLECS